MKLFSKEKPTIFHIVITCVIAWLCYRFNQMFLAEIIILASFLPYAFRKSPQNNSEKENDKENTVKPLPQKGSMEELIQQISINTPLKVVPGIIFSILMSYFLYGEKQQYIPAIYFLVYFIVLLFLYLAFEKNLSVKRYAILSILSIPPFLTALAVLVYFFFIIGDDGPQTGIWLAIFLSPLLILWFIAINKDLDIIRTYRVLSHKIKAEQQLAQIKIPKDFSNTLTPLLGAIITGDIALVQTALTDQPEELNTAYAQNGNTPLHVAALNGYTDIVRLLLAQPGIDTTRTNNEGKTALDLAREKGFEEIALLLENNHIK